MDKFLLSKVGGSENRPVELSLLHSFKRMRRFQPFSAIVEALRTSELVELTNDDTCVRRKVPLPETVTESADSTIVRTFEDKAMNRSIYAKGFGEEEPSTQFDIEAFFAPYGPTNAVRLRRTNEKIFKGSVFVEFDSEETQQKFLALDPKPKWKGTADLLIKSKKDYCEEKVKEIEAGRLKPSRGRGNFRGRGRGDNRRGGDQKRGFNKGRGGQRGRGRGNRNQEGGRRENMKDSRYVLDPPRNVTPKADLVLVVLAVFPSSSPLRTNLQPDRNVLEKTSHLRTAMVPHQATAIAAIDLLKKLIPKKHKCSLRTRIKTCFAEGGFATCLLLKVHYGEMEVAFNLSSSQYGAIWSGQSLGVYNRAGIWHSYTSKSPVSSRMCEHVPLRTRWSFDKPSSMCMNTCL